MKVSFPEGSFLEVMSMKVSFPEDRFPESSFYFWETTLLGKWQFWNLSLWEITFWETTYWEADLSGKCMQFYWKNKNEFSRPQMSAPYSLWFVFLRVGFNFLYLSPLFAVSYVTLHSILVTPGRTYIRMPGDHWHEFTLKPVLDMPVFILAI